MVPAALQIVVRHAPRPRRSTTAGGPNILYGAAPIPLDLLRECIGGVRLRLRPAVRHDRERPARWSICRRRTIDPAGNASACARPACRCRRRAEDHRRERSQTLGPNEVGEVAVRSPANMAGYWKLPEATAEHDRFPIAGCAPATRATSTRTATSVHPRSREGHDHLRAARTSIRPRSRTRSTAIRTVAEVAVIGVPDDKWGEAVKAVVALKPRAAGTAEDIIALRAHPHRAASRRPRASTSSRQPPRERLGRKILRVA